MNLFFPHPGEVRAFSVSRTHVKIEVKIGPFLVYCLRLRM